MKEIIACISVLLMSAIALVPTANASISEFSGGYPPSDDTLIKYDMQSDPPAGEPSELPDLVVNDELPKWHSKVFEVVEAMPGESGAATLKLQNLGANGTLEVQLLNLVDEPLITAEPEPTPDNGELSQNLDMLIWWDDNQNGVYEPPGEVLIAEGTLKNIADVIYNLGTLNYMETKYLGMAWLVDTNVGNEIMRDRCTFDIQFALHQLPG